MDKNKETVMRDVKYRIRKTCKDCFFGSFNNKDWGVCARQEYHHLKHNRVHLMTIHRAGYCTAFEWKSVDLGGYDQFRE